MSIENKGEWKRKSRGALEITKLDVALNALQDLRNQILSGHPVKENIERTAQDASDKIDSADQQIGSLTDIGSSLN